MSKEVAYKNRDRFLELGLAIATLRKRKGLSQDDLPTKAGIRRSHLSSIAQKIFTDELLDRFLAEDQKTIGQRDPFLQDQVSQDKLLPLLREEEALS